MRLKTIRVIVMKNGNVSVEEIKDYYKYYAEVLEINSPITMIERYVNKIPYTFICDDEGLLKKGLLQTHAYCRTASEVIAGNVIIASVDPKTSKMQSLTNKEIENFMNAVETAETRKHCFYETNAGTKIIIIKKGEKFVRYEV